MHSSSNDTNLLAAMNNLADTLDSEGNYAEAEKLQRVKRLTQRAASTDKTILQIFGE